MNATETRVHVMFDLSIGLQAVSLLTKASSFCSGDTCINGQRLANYVAARRNTVDSYFSRRHAKDFGNRIL